MLFNNNSFNNIYFIAYYTFLPIRVSNSYFRINKLNKRSVIHANFVNGFYYEGDLILTNCYIIDKNNTLQNRIDGLINEDNDNMVNIIASMQNDKYYSQIFNELLPYYNSKERIITYLHHYQYHS